jgi:hypothetical protein
MTKITLKQQTILNAIEKLGKGSVVDVSKIINEEIRPTFAHLRRLHKLELIHIKEWGSGQYNHPLKIYALGKGVDAVINKKEYFDKVKQDAKRKLLTKSKFYDPNAPLAPNNGWRSTIHSWDRTVSQHDHIEFMARFHPHPDPASAWLFHQPRSKI